MYFKTIFIPLLVLLISSCGSEVQKDSVKPSTDEITFPVDSFYCYAKGIAVNKDSIKFQFDRVDFLHSDSAKKAMIEDGLLNKDEYPPNDIYIRNKNSFIETLPVDTAAAVLMQTLSNDESGNFIWNEKIKIERFEKLLSKNSERCYINFPFFIKTKNNKIILIKEQYLP